MEVKVNNSSKLAYIMVAKGPELKSSIFVFNDKMKLQSFDHNLGCINILQLVDTMYDGLLFALDKDKNLLTIDLSLLSQGITPFKIVNLQKNEEDIVLWADECNICLLYASGRLQKI